MRAVQRVGDAVVAVVGGAVAGFVMVVDDEVEQVYVARNHRGSGVAVALLAEAERLVAAGGHGRAWLAVVAGNLRARRFYARNGWEDTGLFDHHAPSDQGPVRVPAHRYVKRLMGPRRAEVHSSASTWRQPAPPAVSPERSALVKAIAERVLTIGTGRLLVGIDGLTASGKTSFGHELAEWISAAGRPVLRASLDDFKKPWKDRHLYDRESGEGYYRNAYDYDVVKCLLLDPCRTPGATSAVLCSIDPLTQQNHAAERTALTSDTVLIVDGVFAFRPEINGYWDFRVWLHVDAELSVQRGAARDQNWAGSEAESIHRNRYLVAEDIYLREVEPLPMADVIVDNSTFASPRILTP